MPSTRARRKRSSRRLLRYAFDILSKPVKMVVFDRTCSGRGGLPGLSHAWSVGSWLYRLRGDTDFAFGASSWQEALRFMATHHAERPIEEIQFWGHGKWGDARIGADVLDERALTRQSEHASAISKVAERLLPESLFWLRTCESFGAELGHGFARALSERLGVAVAGHTYVIGWWQSGLHRLLPGTEPDWDPAEGLVEGSAARPERACVSTPLSPRTITCLDAGLPSWA